MDEPKVLIGDNTNKEKIIGNKEIKDYLHLTIETFDLLTSLRCARTYFLTKQLQFEHKVT